MNQFFTYDPQKKEALLGLKVKASAKVNKIENFMLINDRSYLKLTIKAIPEHGKANEAIVNFLASEWKLSKADLEIISGMTYNLKTLSIKNIAPDYLNSILKHYI